MPVHQDHVIFKEMKAEVRIKPEGAEVLPVHFQFDGTIHFPGKADRFRGKKPSRSLPLQFRSDGKMVEVDPSPVKGHPGGHCDPPRIRFLHDKEFSPQLVAPEDG